MTLSGLWIVNSAANHSLPTHNCTYLLLQRQRNTTLSSNITNNFRYEVMETQSGGGPAPRPPVAAPLRAAPGAGQGRSLPAWQAVSGSPGAPTQPCTHHSASPSGRPSPHHTRPPDFGGRELGARATATPPLSWARGTLVPLSTTPLLKAFPLPSGPFLRAANRGAGSPGPRPASRSSHSPPGHLPGTAAPGPVSLLHSGGPKAKTSQRATSSDEDTCS